MKIIYTFLVLFLICTVKIKAQCHEDLIVHEWGTFTSLLDSKGKPLPDIYFDETSLPDFVYGIEGTVEHPPTKDLEAVTVKMETPVLYFYTKDSCDVHVQVDFAGGSINQWYPQATVYETMPQQYIDFSKFYTGSVQWDAHIYPPHADIEYSRLVDNILSEWDDPRYTDANMLRSQVDGENERFLFYRGLGNFETPIKAWFRNETELVIHNAGTEDIGYVSVYDNENRQLLDPATIWWQGSLNAGEQVVVQAISYEPYRYDQPHTPIINQGWVTRGAWREQFTDALEAEGLYKAEAEALISTWYASYSGHNPHGLRIFWTVPRSFTDAILPLEVDPQPQAIERVMVGRTEILSPKFEQQLLADYQYSEEWFKRSWGWHRFHDTYLIRAKELAAELAELATQQETVVLSPNPCRESLLFTKYQLQEEEIGIQLINIKGQVIWNRTERITVGRYQTIWDMQGLPAGIYWLKVKSENGEELHKIVKQ